MNNLAVTAAGLKGKTLDELRDGERELIPLLLISKAVVIREGRIWPSEDSSRQLPYNLPVDEP